jgi:hypothetical protein
MASVTARGIKKSFKKGKAKRGVALKKGKITYGQKGLLQKGAGKAGAAVKKAGKSVTVRGVKKSFKSGKAKRGLALKGGKITVGQKGAIQKGAAKAGGVYRMTAAHKKAIGDALRGKKRR